MALFTSGGFGTATMLLFVDDEALGVSLGVAIDTAKEGVLAADVFVLEAILLGGKADGDAGAVAVEAGAFHEAGIDCIANFASWSDNFKESFFLIVASRSAQAVLYSFFYLSASASSALTSASVTNLKCCILFLLEVDQFPGLLCEVPHAAPQSPWHWFRHY